MKGLVVQKKRATENLFRGVFLSFRRKVFRGKLFRGTKSILSGKVFSGKCTPKGNLFGERFFGVKAFRGMGCGQSLFGVRQKGGKKVCKILKAKTLFLKLEKTFGIWSRIFSHYPFFPFFDIWRKKNLFMKKNQKPKNKNKVKTK